jgi:predicted DNA-binding protein
MTKNNKVVFTMRMSEELFERTEKQSRKEGRSTAEFIRRVLDRYLLEKEFRGTRENSDVAVAAQETINENRKLLELLRNS